MIEREALSRKLMAEIMSGPTFYGEVLAELTADGLELAMKRPGASPHALRTIAYPECVEDVVQLIQWRKLACSEALEDREYLCQIDDQVKVTIAYGALAGTERLLTST